MTRHHIIKRLKPYESVTLCTRGLEFASNRDKTWRTMATPSLADDPIAKQSREFSKQLNEARVISRFCQISQWLADLLHVCAPRRTMPLRF